MSIKVKPTHTYIYYVFYWTVREWLGKGLLRDLVCNNPTLDFGKMRSPDDLERILFKLFDKKQEETVEGFHNRIDTEQKWAYGPHGSTLFKALLIKHGFLDSSHLAQ